jgi:hypothetical protein
MIPRRRFLAGLLLAAIPPALVRARQRTMLVLTLTADTTVAAVFRHEGAPMHTTMRRTRQRTTLLIAALLMLASSARPTRMSVHARSGPTMPALADSTWSTGPVHGDSTWST